MDTVEEDRKPTVMLPPTTAPSSATGMNDYMYFDTSDSVPKLNTDSSCSEHVVSPEFTSEVQSEPKWKEWGNANALSNPYNYLDATMDVAFAPQLQGNNQMSPLQDIFMYLQKPF